MTYVKLPIESSYPAPDGSEVRLLANAVGGGLAHFTLPPGRTSKAKQHKSVEELWYFTAGTGEMCIGDCVTVVGPGASFHIPPRTRFQFRSTGEAALEAVAATIPPWPGEAEAQDAPSCW